MAATKVPTKFLPWVVVVLSILAFGGLVGLMTDNHIWPFRPKEPPKESPPASRAPATTPAP